MQLAVTIYEETPETAIDVIRSLDADHDVIELRADAFGGRTIDWTAIRAATSKMMVATNRGGGHVDIDAALAAGIDFVDVEWGSEIPDRDPLIVSHHDYDGMPDLDRLVSETSRYAHVKIAATPHTFA